MDAAATGPFDDAAIVRPEGGSSPLILTIDVITPIVDDPRAFGGIAAANSVSDVYAMGGRPMVALSFVGFPSDVLPMEVLGEILAGAQEVAARAGCAIVGGHTVSDAEPKCGLAVVGIVDPARVWSHKSARAGDVLVLTKPLGTGIVGQSIRAGASDPRVVEAATAQMLALNDAARDVGLAVSASSCTDITGFGFLGHLKHIVEASSVSARISAAAVPLLGGVVELARKGVVPGGSKRNLSYASSAVRFDDAIDPALRLVLSDAQTSGGLLLCVPADRADEAVAMLRDRGTSCAAIVGELTTSEAASLIDVAP